MQFHWRWYYNNLSQEGFVLVFLDFLTKNVFKKNFEFFLLLLSF